MNIHSTAIIGENVSLGKDVIIGPYAIVEDHVVIGDRSRIEAHAVIKSFTRMGNDNHVFSHAQVGGEPQDLKFGGEESWLEIGSRNRIREFSTMHRGTSAGGGVTRIGDDNLFMAYTHVGHDCLLGSHIVMSNAATLAGHVTVGDWAILSGLCAVHQFSRIGKHAFVGGITGVSQDVPPWMLVAALSRVHGAVQGPNLVGLRRAGASKELIAAMKKAFQLVWRSDMLRKDALQELETRYPDFPEIFEFTEFIRNSERGICPCEKNLQK
ncbi:MAG: acyl-ACP--UDP-N-acetylglucosamine O-acyltransferase [Desulfovibrionaceae bacterium]|nr:acyl-ACP--UDP-N-acetylglucosamine O-acyltransferase [Desulfovibrionaceae bacterium]